MGALSLRNHAGPVEVCLSWSRKSDKASKPTVSVIMFTALSAAQFHSWNVRCVGLFTEIRRKRPNRVRPCPR